MVVSSHCDAVQCDPVHPGQVSTGIWWETGGGGPGAWAEPPLRPRRVTLLPDRHRQPKTASFAPLQPLRLHGEVENLEKRVQTARLALASQLPPGRSDIPAAFPDIEDPTKSEETHPKHSCFYMQVVEMDSITVY